MNRYRENLENLITAFVAGLCIGFPIGLIAFAVMRAVW